MLHSSEQSSRRRAAVAGRFYPADADALRRVIHECLDDVPREPRRCIAVIVPHAGLMYSGKCAGAVFGRVAIPPTVVILAPNHSGRGRPPGAALWARGSFATPLGDIEIDERVAAILAAECELVADDPAAHRFEHAVEVVLPFLQVLAPGVRIVPLVLAWDDWARAERLAGALARVCPEPNETLLVASSDMTHYESAASARAKDRHAQAAIERLDGRALLEACARYDVTMCGRVPAAVVLEAARRLGASRADLIDYRHSGMVDGDESHVVSYAGVAIS